MTDSESMAAPAGPVRKLREDRGQGLVEYALILALVSLAAIVALGFLSGKINNLFSKAGNSLNTVQVAQATPPPPPPPPANGTTLNAGNVASSSGLFTGPNPGSYGPDFFGPGQIQSCNSGTVNQLLCLGGGGSWTTINQAGVYDDLLPAHSGGCSFTLANGYTFSGTWVNPVNSYREGTSGSPDYGQACL